MSRLLERLGVELPLAQAGMGGGLATHELAAAVSDAGGLGTLGFDGPGVMARELAAARNLTGRPVAVNLLLPFAGAAHWRVARDADTVVTFWGRPIRRSPGVWLHQAGSVEEARAARAAGADGVIVQGVEAGGHVRGTRPALELLADARAALGADYPLLLAGGLADRDDVRRAIDAGADAALLGTRFLMTDESRARNAYKHRLMEARETVLTELFGLGWPRAQHRVMWNEACERWLTGDPRGPAWVRQLHGALSPLAKRLPMAAQAKMAAQQRADLPLFGPVAAAETRPRTLLDAGPLYAGESVARIHDVSPAAEVVRELVP